MYWLWSHARESRVVGVLLWHASLLCIVIILLVIIIIIIVIIQFVIMTMIIRRFGTKCSGCGQGISPQDLVRKARDKVLIIIIISMIIIIISMMIIILSKMTIISMIVIISMMTVKNMMIEIMRTVMIVVIKII